jgi:hypothetical protein
MPPLFSCRGCGLSIERSMATYRRLRGQVLCSTCQDKQDSVVKRWPGNAAMPGTTASSPSSTLRWAERTANYCKRQKAFQHKRIIP